ncbi:MAG TPA: CoA transferase [Acidimicrobiales bacterium]|nr:CoA transferase [Acidimicrobiales bacterium]
MAPPSRRQEMRDRPAAGGGAGPMALDGVRVLDFTRLGFGAQATLICGCLGAEVIRVESTVRPDPIRVMPPYIPESGERGEGFGAATLANATAAPSANRGGIFYKYNTGGKKSITVDARHPKGLALLKGLVTASDVVAESFAAGTLARWGLDYETMRSLRPDIVYVSMCGFGHSGPDTAHVTMGPTAQALTGLTFLVGLPDRPPAGWSFSYLDHVGGYLGAVAILTGLLHRRRTGEGQHIDVSQLEPATALSGAIVLDAALNGRPSRRPGFPTGNRRQHPPHAPAGAYRAEGEDRWVVVSCRTDEQWGALVRAMGSPAWASDVRFATVTGRVEHADELDAHIEAWTKTRDRYAVMELLQQVGVPAGAVQDAADRLERDPQLKARGHFTMLGNTEVDPMPLEGMPVRMSRTAPHTGGRLRRGPPRLGEDNAAVLGDVLGMDADEVRRLEADGVLA